MAQESWSVKAMLMRTLTIMALVGTLMAGTATAEDADPAPQSEPDEPSTGSEGQGSEANSTASPEQAGETQEAGNEPSPDPYEIVELVLECLRGPRDCRPVCDDKAPAGDGVSPVAIGDDLRHPGVAVATYIDHNFRFSNYVGFGIDAAGC